MPSSHSLPGLATRADHRWLIAAFCFSVLLHGLLAIIHSSLPTLPIRAMSNPAPTRLKVELQFVRQASTPVSTTSAQAARDTSVSLQTPSRANAPSDRRPPPAVQTPNRMVVTPADSGSASAPPSIDLEAAREIARQTVRSQPAPTARTEQDGTDSAEPETVLGRKIQRAAHPDCRTSYAGAGLLAIPLLLKDAVSDGGCKW